MNNIPNFREHSSCKSCGWCCAVVPITASEDFDIRQYLKGIDAAVSQRLVSQPRGRDECQFHDRDKRRCAIYSVRPKVCRMFGSVLGMNCPHGNSANLNIRHLLAKEPVQLMPEYLGRKVSQNHSIPLARLSTDGDYFRKVSYILAAAEVDYKFRNCNNLFQCSIEIDEMIMRKFHTIKEHY